MKSNSGRRGKKGEHGNNYEHLGCRFSELFEQIKNLLFVHRKAIGEKTFRVCMILRSPSLLAL